MPVQRFLATGVDTATGEPSGADAWLQVPLIPLALAFAALANGGVHALLACAITVARFLLFPP
jgi:hypothetical protein